MILLFWWSDVSTSFMAWEETVFRSRLILTIFYTDISSTWFWYLLFFIAFQLILLVTSLLCYKSLTLIFLLFRVIDNSLSCLDFVFNSFRNLLFDLLVNFHIGVLSQWWQYLMFGIWFQVFSYFDPLLISKTMTLLVWAKKVKSISKFPFFFWKATALSICFSCALLLFYFFARLENSDNKLLSIRC